ncbi:MAG TPA: GGDEF domain-containing protein [Terracidiphilus sp.]|jgi:diguanylate cyclase (GGDEF)-like protein|nr:GGDEF domain-containing protein [Terracidiphilus sp.]
MPDFTPVLQPTEPDESLLDRLALIERVTLVAAIAFFALNLTGRLLVLLSLGFASGRHLMSAGTASAALVSALSLHLSGPRFSRRVQRLAVLLAAAVAVVCAAIACVYAFYLSPEAQGSGGAASMHFETAAVFAILGAALIFIRAQKRLAVMTADFLTFFLVLFVLILISGRLIAALGIFGPTTAPSAPWSTLVGLAVLTSMAFLRRAENGVYSILLGRGIGSNIARGLTPLLFALPYVRECMRARFFSIHRMPPHYTTAILASTAVMLSFALLLFLAWRINHMEVEIHDLSLRDALTDLYNIRGFQLLAEQALRMARRAHLPFSVLYIDLDDLKRVNDTYGHQAGSALLIETGKILKSSFRETDVVGRIGGDEFVVAGQFNASGISLAAQRIGECATRRNAESDSPYQLSLSIGSVTTDAGPQQNLDELLGIADRAMYEEKRRKKLPVAR